MSYLQICCKDIIDSIVDCFYPYEILQLMGVMGLIRHQLYQSIQ